MKIDKRTLEDLEEDIEYSSVTSLRESLLGVVKNLRKNPAKRYLITKHGQPQAVLMSFQTYTLLKKTMNQALEYAAGKSQSEKVSDAFARLRAERPHGAALEAEPAVADVTPLATNEEDVFSPEEALKELAKIRATYERMLQKRSNIIIEKQKQARKKQPVRRVAPLKYENI